MNYLSLFSGVGGGDIAMEMMLGFKCLGRVEYEKYPQDVLYQRQEDGLFNVCPIYSDIRDFNREYAKEYKGMVEIVTAGFPCQPFSVAGKRKGKDDERNMWPETWNTLRIVRPKYFFGENVPGLLNSGYFGTILCNLSEIGYNVKWTVLGADDVGARHRRKRLWILAYATESRLER